MAKIQYPQYQGKKIYQLGEWKEVIFSSLLWSYALPAIVIVNPGAMDKDHHPVPIRAE